MLQRFKSTIVKERQAIDQNIIDNLIKSMSNRIFEIASKHRNTIKIFNGTNKLKNQKWSYKYETGENRAFQQKKYRYQLCILTFGTLLMYHNKHILGSLLLHK